MTRLRFRAALRRGYTLVELLLALAVLAVLGGIVVPPALRMYSDSRLQEIAEQVRFQLGSTRSRAIEGGLVYQFRFEPDGRHYIAVPFEREFEGSDVTSTGSGATVGLGIYTRFAGELPEGFRFIDDSPAAAMASTTGLGGQTLTQEAFGELPDAQKLAGVTWSQPILFLPDGSGVDYALEVADDRGRAVRLEVRGLTGATAMSRLIAASGDGR